MHRISVFCEKRLIWHENVAFLISGGYNTPAGFTWGTLPSAEKTVGSIFSAALATPRRSNWNCVSEGGMSIRVPPGE
jgi:hypothetical protein